MVVGAAVPIQMVVCAVVAPENMILKDQTADHIPKYAHEEHDVED